MLLRNSISNTKKFFSKTIKTFKSFISDGFHHYHKLPKTSPFSSSSIGIMNYGDDGDELDKLDKFYKDFTDKWDETNRSKKAEKKKIKKVTSSSSARSAVAKEESEEIVLFHEEKEKQDEDVKGRMMIRGEKRKTNLVEQKLKEMMVMMMDNNVENVLDIEEVLHYYSRLTCPAYIDIVDKFFMDIYSEFSCQTAVSTRENTSSRLRLSYHHR